MLYQNVRPVSFDEIVGNTSIVSALKKVVKRKSKDRPHTFLFSGPSGCGKTTTARILALELGCSLESVVEMNAANTRGIDSIRELTTNAQLGTMFSNNKAYIIDESHQLTKPAQQGLLKIIEDCPKHCYFIFCTTEPQNLLKTILNRCMKYEVFSLTQSEILDVLLQAVEKQDFEPPSEFVFEKIVEICDDCPREALNLLEKVIDEPNVDVALSLLTLDKEDEVNIFNLSRLLSLNLKLRESKWREIIDVLSRLKDDPERLRISLQTVMTKKLFAGVPSIEMAKDIGTVITALSTPVYSGGKGQLCANILKHCF